jgi:hypothetical protein
MKIHVVLLSLLSLLATPRPSSAQPDSRAVAAAEASAREHFQRGQRLSGRGEYAAAYREFAAGYALTERPLFLFNMAEAARASGDVVKARDNYERFLRADPKNALASTAQARLAALGPSAAPAAPGSPHAPAAGAGPAVPDPVAGGTAPSVATVPVGPSSESPRLVPPPATAVTSPGLTGPTTVPPERAALASSAAPVPVWKKLPFWAAVGGSVLVGGVLIYAFARDDSACGGGCSQLNFR